MRYPVLETLMFQRQISQKEMADRLGLSQKSLYKKLRGMSTFTWPEAVAIKKMYFPNMQLEKLLSSDNDLAHLVAEGETHSQAASNA